MTDPARSTSSAPSPVSTTRSQDPSAPADSAAEAASLAIDASRQGGVVNPGELAKEVAAAYARSPAEGDALQAAVNQQLSARDQASLNDHLVPTLAAAAASRAVQPDTVPLYRVEGPGNERIRVGPDGAIDVPAVMTKKGAGPERNLYVNVDDASRARDFLARPNPEFSNNTIKAIEVPRSFLNELLATAVPEAVRADHPTRPVIADPSKARDQFGLSGPQIERLRDVAVPGSGQAAARPSDWTGSVGAARQGAVAGAVTDTALTAFGVLRDGELSRTDAQEIFASSVRGAAVGASYAVTERGLVQLADRAIGPTIHRAAAAVAPHVTAVDTVVAGAATRTAATRLAGAGAAGAVISAGFSVYENRDGLARGDSQAIGRVAGDVAVGAGAALSGAAAGAAVGSVVPVVGTAVGAVVGLAVGVGADYVMRAGGIDKAVAGAVTSGVDAVKGAASRVASWLGW